jgi:ketosteroid isomerase-like protein
MSQENVEVVRSIQSKWERGDYTSVEWAHPDIDYVFADGPTLGRWTGVAEMAGAWRDFLGAWKEYRVEASEYRELDNERVLVLVHRSGRGKRSGLDLGRMQGQGANLFHVQDGKVTKLVLYFDSERALADLGLSE